MSIVVSLPATMECAHGGCTRECAHGGCTRVQRVQLCLMGDGTFRPRPPKDHGWQIVYAENGAFLCRCPQHHALIEQPKSMLEVKH